MLDSYFDDEKEFPEQQPRLLDCDGDPVLAIVNILADSWFEVCGPLFWGTLIIGFFCAAFASS